MAWTDKCHHKRDTASVSTVPERCGECEYSLVNTVEGLDGRWEWQKDRIRLWSDDDGAREEDAEPEVAKLADFLAGLGLPIDKGTGTKQNGKRRKKRKKKTW